MELHGMHKIFHPSHLGEEKQQMLNLNRRLETYLCRVKCLEEENEMLANEIKVLRHNNQGTLTRRRGLEEELRQARLEVDAAWRERVCTEVEVQKLTEEIQGLEMQRQMEAEAKMLAKTKMEQSRKELEDEQRAQIWLREKVNQLEHEMKFLIQTHEEDVAHLEATLSQSRAEMLPNQIHRSKQTPDLLNMGHEFSQRATRVWQEASEAYQGQLAELEESLDQARSRLSQVCLEKRESQLKLQTLEKEIASAQDVKLHLEKTVAQRSEEHRQEIQQLGMHLEELEVEKVELGQQIDHLLQENHSLMQLKMSLGLEVATYKALLDGEGLGRDAVLLNKPRSISIRDAVLSPYGVKKNYPIQLSASLKNTYPSSGQGRTGSIITPTQFLSRRPAALREPPKTSSKPAETAAVKSATLESPYPKIVQNGAAENFRPEEVHEKVTYAEPLSPPNEEEVSNRMSEDEDKTMVERVIESVVSHTAVLGLSREEPLNEKTGNKQSTALSPTSCDVRITELPCNFSDELLKDLAFEGETEEEKVEYLRAQADGSTKAEHVQDETSDSETEAMLEPTFESRPSSPESEIEPLESIFNRNDESISNVDAVIMRQESSTSTVEVHERDDEDKLYPDGEEMDTWDSVIERKVSERVDDGVENEGNKQHAEPEEDLSTKDPEENRKVGQEVNMGFVLPQVDEGHHAIWELEHFPPPDKEEGGDEEDSQNVSVSWRTELESDSYAQDNTLADTRPLIRYKSDDTDANTQASHFDESESSEGEQEKKAGEAGSGTWTDGKPKTFGTMEDLCEEVEEETVDDDYNMGYTHVEDRDADQGKKVSEYDILLKGAEKVEEMVMSGVEGYSEEETEELTGATVHTNTDYDEELETDRLVEQELENLSTDSYSAHFGHEKVREDILEMNQKSITEMKEQETTGNTSTCESENYESALTTAVISKSLEREFFSDSSPDIQLASTLTEEDVKEQKETEKAAGGSSSEFVKSEFEPATTITRDTSERQLFSDPSVELPSTNAQLVNHQKGIEKLIEDTESSEPEMIVNYEQLVSQEHPTEDAEDFHKFLEDGETTEWEIPENTTKESETRDQIKHDLKNDNLHKKSDEIITHQEEAAEVSLDSALDENNIFKVKDVKDSSFHSLFTSDGKNDFWVSSLETGATYTPNDACNDSAEQTKHNQGFADNRDWGYLENPKVINGNSKVDIELSGLDRTEEQEQGNAEVKKVFFKNVVEGEMVHSEESDVEAESWSSGEETA
ncbi:nestin [Gambusia affinis]|uniref:nestin n=1 Tax=Gambusia affinis TaxID=33528 RepID=UPI001CDC32E2|nr:nestin [Gambusia affinis]